MYKPLRLLVRDEWNIKDDEISKSEEHTVFWKVTPYSVVVVLRRFEGIYWRAEFLFD
jgi:hypothetical protein